MKYQISVKFLISVLVSGIIAATAAMAADVGGGVSVYVPMSVFSGQGSASYEAGLSTSFSFGKFIGVPIGLAYDKMDGQSLLGSITTSSPALLTDTFLGYAGLQITLPVGPLFVEATGGGVGVWNAKISPYADRIAAATAGGGTGTVRAFSDLTVAAPLGYGYFAGGTIGMKVKKISVLLSATYRWATSPATIQGTYYDIATAGPSVSGPTTLNDTRSAAIISGILFAVTGRFAF